MLRKVRFWVRYRPKSQIVVKIHRTKADATKAQISGEVVFDCQGFYASGMVKKPRGAVSASDGAK